MMMAVVGGVGSPLGGIVASLMLTMIPEGLRVLARVIIVCWSRNHGSVRALVPALGHRRPDRTAAQMSVLELSGVSKRFGGLQALSEVSLSVSPGEVLGLIGPNGAGKSTLVSCITGVLRIDGGSIRFGDSDIQLLPSHRRARRGIARTFQKVRLADQLTVYENVASGLASHSFRRASGWASVLRPLSAAAVGAGREPHAGAGRPRRCLRRGLEVAAVGERTSSKSRARSCPSRSCHRWTNPRPASPNGN